MEINNISKLKSKFVTKQVGDDLVLVPLSGNVSKMNELFTMNETARYIWENMTEKTSIEELADKMILEFDVEKNRAIKDIEIFMEKISIMYE